MLFILNLWDFFDSLMFNKIVVLFTKYSIDYIESKTKPM